MKDAVYQVITDRVVALLQQGTVPWHKPWAGQEHEPRNLCSRKPYRGVNVFLLNAMSFQSQYWLTFKQAQELGGNVRKGERACPVVFWKWLDSQEIDATTGNNKRIPLLRYYSVFNVAQCEGIETRVPTSATVTRAANVIDTAKAIVDGMPKRPEIKHGLAKAFYSPAGDFVGMPTQGQFEHDEDYYNVLFHELTHATGHDSRLNRKGVAGAEGNWSSFGSTPYAKEELVAEMGAAFLCGHAGIVERTIDNSAAYIKSWLERLKDDVRLVVMAAAQVQRAADFILGGQVKAESGVEP
jgi:antirestriction protein ArdC